MTHSCFCTMKICAQRATTTAMMPSNNQNMCSIVLSGVINQTKAAVLLRKGSAICTNSSRRRAPACGSLLLPEACARLIQLALQLREPGLDKSAALARTLNRLQLVSHLGCSLQATALHCSHHALDKACKCFHKCGYSRVETQLHPSLIWKNPILIPQSSLNSASLNPENQLLNGWLSHDCSTTEARDFGYPTVGSFFLREQLLRCV